MNAALAIALKDLKIAFREPSTVFFSYGFPILYAVFFSLLFSNSTTALSIKLGLCDQANTDLSKAFVARVAANDGITLERLNENEARAAIRNGKLPFAIIIGEDFGAKGGAAGLKILADPAQRAASGMLQGLVVRSLMQAFQAMLSDPVKGRETLEATLAQIDTAADLTAEQKSNLKDLLTNAQKWISNRGAGGTSVAADPFEPGGLTLEEVAVDNTGPRSFDLMFPSGIIWGLMGAALGFGTALIGERNSGTLARILSSPVDRKTVLLGKALACFISCVLIGLVTLGVGIVFFGLNVRDPVALLLALSCCAVCFVGMASFVSVLGRTEQSASGLGWALMFVPAMLGGAMMPLMFMPAWVQELANVSPIKWALEAIMGATWRGLGVSGILLPCAILVAIGLVMFTLGTRLFKWSA